jgi:hypothetical protein
MPAPRKREMHLAPFFVRGGAGQAKSVQPHCFSLGEIETDRMLAKVDSNCPFQSWTFKHMTYSFWGWHVDGNCSEL